ncbi:MAG TPA: carboxypeptidase regulatory-like domain-containing protein, partial [Acidobacteriota bacterium]
NILFLTRPAPVVLLVLLIALTGPSLSAQSSTGSIFGKVTDPSGAVVPGATVTARRLGWERTTLSDDRGQFHLAGLMPGQWELLVELAGFRSSRSRIFLDVNQQFRHDVQLQIGIASSIEVTDVAEPSSESPTVSFVLPPVGMTELPLNARDFMSLASLGPGPIPRHLGGFIVDGFTDLQPRRGEVGFNFPVNGARANMNAHLLDGTSNSDGHVQAFVANPSIESILEFRVQTANSSAEFGRMGGGQINVVTRSGSEKIHGSLFEFLRNEKLDARNFFDPHDQKKIPFKQSQFGGTIGGPLDLPFLAGRPRLFYFSSYEGLRSRLAHTSLVTVPTAALRSGNFAGRKPIFDPQAIDPATGLRRLFSGNQIPANRIDPVAPLLLEQFQPLPNRPGDLNNYTDSRPQANRRDVGTVRIDYAAGGRDLIFGRYTLNADDDLTPGFFPGTGTVVGLRAQNLTLAYNHSFSPVTLNDWRFGFNRLRLFDIPENAFKNDVVGKLGINGIDRDPVNFGFPRFDIPEFVMVGDELLLPLSQRDNTFHLSDSVTAIRGKHALKLGVELEKFQYNFLQRQSSRGQFQFTGVFTSNLSDFEGTGEPFADFLLGLPQRTIRTVGAAQAYLRRSSTSGFLQDDYKATSRLTLNLGLRYEYFGPFMELRDNYYNLDYSQLPRAPQLVRAAKNGPLGRSLVHPDRNNFAPRIGFAFRPFSGGSALWTLRGGYGVFYDQGIGARFYDLVRNGIRTETNQAAPEKPVLTLRQGFPAGADTGIPSYFSSDVNARTGYVQNWNLAVQFPVPNAIAAELAYVGAKGTKLERYRTFNTPLHELTGENLPPRPGVIQELRSFPELGKIIHRENSASSTFHSLQAKAERRFSGGLFFQSSFVWAKSIDDADGILPGFYDSIPAQDERNLRAERALSFFDVRARFTSSLVWDPPVGRNHSLWANQGLITWLVSDWQIAGNVLEQGGTPLNPVLLTNPANADTSTRPNRVPGVEISLPRSQRTPERFFNTDAFAFPAPYTFGNAGRNIITGPGNNIVDLSLSRRFKPGEKAQVQFRSDFFNLFNHPNWGIPLPYVDFGPAFGSIAASGEPRRIQLSLKITF